MARHSDPLAGLDEIEAGRRRASALLLIEQGHLNNWWACPADCPCPDECEYGAWLANLLKLAATVATSLLARRNPQ